MDRLSGSWLRPVQGRQNRLLDHAIGLTVPIVTYAIISSAFRSYRSHISRPPTILRSPREAIQTSSHPETAPYPLDALPGARDVDSPYGSIRVYEWGPDDGRKVLFIHGISTPCIAFASLAQKLVDQGCRVMLFDLFGRGYSDTPCPSTIRQDMRLWTAQIMTVLASSPLGWTGSGERFATVGYSMGGGIAASFASYFPQLVSSLVLIAPGGLLRHNRIAMSSKLLYSDLLPSSLVSYFVRRRLRGNTPYEPPAPPPQNQDKPATTPSSAAAAEIPTSKDPIHPALAPDSTAPLTFPSGESNPAPPTSPISIASVVAWQTDTHPGFLPAFISSIQHAPVSDEHERWSVIGARCAARRSHHLDDRDMLPGLDENKVLVLLSKDDSVIVADEVEEDATKALGEENVRVVRLEGGHDVPVVNAEGCCEAILKFWQQ